MIPGFVATKLFGAISGAAAIVLLGLLIYVGIDSLAKNRTINDLRDHVEQVTTERDAARRDLATCRSNTQTLEASIQRHNQALADARAAADSRVAGVQRNADQWRQRAATAEERARRFMNRPGTGDDCADADALILEGVR